MLLRCCLWGIGRSVFGKDAANVAIACAQGIDVIVVAMPQVYFVNTFYAEVAGHILLFILRAQKLAVGAAEGIVVTALAQPVYLP